MQVVNLFYAFCHMLPVRANVLDFILKRIIQPLKQVNLPDQAVHNFQDYSHNGMALGIVRFRQNLQ